MGKTSIINAKDNPTITITVTDRITPIVIPTLLETTTYSKINQLKILNKYHGFM